MITQTGKISSAMHGKTKTCLNQFYDQKFLVAQYVSSDLFRQIEVNPLLNGILGEKTDKKDTLN